MIAREAFFPRRVHGSNRTPRVLHDRTGRMQPVAAVTTAATVEVAAAASRAIATVVLLAIPLLSGLRFRDPRRNE